MALHFPTAPDELFDILKQPMQHFKNRRNKKLYSLQKIDRYNLSLAVPQQVFMIEAYDIYTNQNLANAKFIGWRYLIMENNKAIAAVETYCDNKGVSQKFGEFNEGVAVENTLSSIISTDQCEQVQKGNFTLRYLRIAELYIESLWLKDEDNTNDILIPLNSVNKQLKIGQFYSVDAFINIIKNIAESKIIHKSDQFF